MKRLGLLLPLLGLLFATPARAQVLTEPAPPPFPDPRKFARGFYASGELGALVFLGRANRYAGAGPNFGVRLGYDFLRWLSVQLHVQGSSLDANLPPPAEGQSFQTFVYTGEAHLQVQIRRFALYAEGGAGLGQLSNNVLDQVAISSGGTLVSLAVIAGGGLDYHTLNRHFSIGIGADYLWLQAFHSTSALTAQAYLKYTH
jgi:hypothetical protein